MLKRLQTGFCRYIYISFDLWQKSPLHICLWEDTHCNSLVVAAALPWNNLHIFPGRELSGLSFQWLGNRKCLRGLISSLFGGIVSPIKRWQNEMPLIARIQKVVNSHSPWLAYQVSKQCRMSICMRRDSPHGLNMQLTPHREIKFHASRYDK